LGFYLTRLEMNEVRALGWDLILVEGYFGSVELFILF
jgi:hypothetical protein